MTDFVLHRREILAKALADRGDALVVTGLGSSTWDLASLGDRPENFYLWGAMGNSAMIGLGLAIARPERRVVVVTGDGEMLMGLTSFTTIGARRPSNLAICVLDNERYTETGRQPTATGLGTDLAAVAKACGFPTTATIRTEAEAGQLGELLLRTPGPVMAVAKVVDEPLPMAVPPRDGGYLKTRFRIGLLGEKAATQP
ncbi:aldehyde dehydrogenase [Thalassobaculum fulvum]|uniref:Aldehyde dehydrogenase n=1 Tax=Thalassobaculum fulvum TaxID=1633335 RepID=A0A919CR97_9PROT|nr:thiamine pyrophosphate-dependent enzyme [Thalassobaculum fulvum]GHD58205.1 aldehyde dehydrogenase [Thalassobaculum fulvum]